MTWSPEEVATAIAQAELFLNEARSEMKAPEAEYKKQLTEVLCQVVALSRTVKAFGGDKTRTEELLRLTEGAGLIQELAHTHWVDLTTETFPITVPHALPRAPTVVDISACFHSKPGQGDQRLEVTWSADATNITIDKIEGLQSGDACQLSISWRVFVPRSLSVWSK